MAKAHVSDRQKFALYIVINPMQHETRQSRKRYDRFWDEIGLEAIAAQCEGKTKNAGDFSDELHEIEMTSDFRDLIIELCSRPGLNTAVGRLLNPLESELLKSRDG